MFNTFDYSMLSDYEPEPGDDMFDEEFDKLLEEANKREAEKRKKEE